MVFAGGALVTAVVAAVIRSGLRALLEPQGKHLDRWRRWWFHPERELASLLEGLLIVALVTQFASRYGLPRWVVPTVVSLWALHLPADAWSWLRDRWGGGRTREIHLRGFLLLELGPLWLRAVVLLLTVGLYSVLSPLRAGLNAGMEFILFSLERWWV